MNETSFVGIICFLLGVIVTAFGYTYVLSNKLATVSAKVDTHIASSGTTCPVHATVASDAAVAKEKAEEVNRRLLQIEETQKRGEL